MAPRSEIAATKLRLALLKSLCNPGAQPSWLWGRRASCPPTKEQSNRQDACLPHRLEAYAPPVPKLFNKAKPLLLLRLFLSFRAESRHLLLFCRVFKQLH